MKRVLGLSVLLILALAVTPCHAASITFAQVQQVNNSKPFVETYASAQNTISVLSAAVMFQFLYPTSGPSEAAHLTLTAITSSPATLVHIFGSLYEIFQTNYSGNFNIVRDSDHVVLLHGVFANASVLSGAQNGASATLEDSVTSGSPHEVVFSSAILAFLPGSQAAFSFSLAGVSPSLSLNGSNYVNDFTASGTGIFSGDFSPEPMSFVLLGTGLLGLGLLRRKLA